MLVALAFKVSLAPFHMWSPDVYQGSPSLITAFMASVVKVSGFGVFFRLMTEAFGGVMSSWISVVAVLVIITLLLANISQICAIKFKNPLTVYFVPGLVPVVPGVTIYDAFRTLLLDEYGNSGKIFLNSFYGAVGLAVGIIIADSIFRVVLNPLLQKKR